MNNSQMVNLTKKTLRHMLAMASGTQVGGILLAGDPGIGKTTAVELIGQLLGLPVITIEVPHITEEHIINIPFIVFNPITGKTTQQRAQVPSDDYELVLAKSNLFNQLMNATPVPEAQYLKHMTQASPAAKSLFAALGGNQTTVPQIIQEVRQEHQVILFLDEFYRQTSVRIRNILRGILNGNIGMHKLPKTVYVMYASNMRDGGIDQIPSNHQFNVVEYKPAKADDWFSYLVAKYESDTHLHLKPVVIKAFKEALTDEDMSFDDVESEVRTSPRRWEQLIAYINTSLPPHDFDAARALITNVENNFIHYQTEQYSSLSKKVVDVVVGLIKATSGIDIAPEHKLEPHEWRSALDHAVEQVINSGGKRKHIPVISGLPGIGKTTVASMVAAKHNLRLIDIDVSELYADDAIGMPIPGNRTASEINVKFSLPKLYKQILSLIEQKDAAYRKHLSEQGSDAEKLLKQYEQQPFKYLIFLDELNRVDEKTFNALRKVVLEKNFGVAGDTHGNVLTLPKESIMIAAINPEGVGTSDLTHHFRDVIDVIPAKASWRDTKEWLMARRYTGVSDTVKQASMNIIEEFIKKFKSNEGNRAVQQRPFFLDVGSTMYISPREYSDMFATLARELSAKIKDLQADPDVEQKDMRADVDIAVAEALEDSLNMIFYKHEVEKHEFMKTLAGWVETLSDSVFNGVISKNADLKKGLHHSLQEYLDGRALAEMPEDIEIVNGNNTMNNHQFIDNVRSMLLNVLSDDSAVHKYILDQTEDKVKLSGEQLTHAVGEKVSKLVNFFNALLFTLHIHNYQHDRLTAVGRSLSTAMSDVRKTLSGSGKLSDDVADLMAEQVVNLRSDIHDTINSLK